VGALTDGKEYTHAYVLKWRASNKGWRALLRHNQGHCIIVKDGFTDLGMYSNRNDAFQDTGYNVRGHAWPLVCVSARMNCMLHCIVLDSVSTWHACMVCNVILWPRTSLARSEHALQISPQSQYWEIVIVTGKASAEPSATSDTGISTLYTMDVGTGEITRRGTVKRVCTC